MPKKPIVESSTHDAARNSMGLSPGAATNRNISVKDNWCPKNDIEFDKNCDPENLKTVTCKDITKTLAEISDRIQKTPLLKSRCCIKFGCELYYKIETLHKTGSACERGALSALRSLTPQQIDATIITASNGNFGMALAYHAQKMNIKSRIMYPENTDPFYVENTKKYGARVLLFGDNFQEAKHQAFVMTVDLGLTYINGYDHPAVIAGMGTIGAEIMEDLPEVDVILVPVGGGALIAGVAAAVKYINPKSQIYGVEPTTCNNFYKAMEKGQPILTEPGKTMAATLGIPMAGHNSLHIASQLVDKMVMVEDDWIARAVLHIAEEEKLIAEPAGATALSALMAMPDVLPELAKKTVVCVITGSNIPNLSLLPRCMERGKALEGRLVKLKMTMLADVPKVQQHIMSTIAGTGCNVLQCYVEHAWIERNDLNNFRVHLVIETRNLEHAADLRRLMTNTFPGQCEFQEEPFSPIPICTCYPKKKGQFRHESPDCLISKMIPYIGGHVKSVPVAITSGRYKETMSEALGRFKNSDTGACWVGCRPNSPHYKKKEDFDEFCDPDNPRSLTYAEVTEARTVITPYLNDVPLMPSHSQKKFSIRLFYKLENLQKTGSFKGRGALYALHRLPVDKKKLGVVVASLGNEGIAMSYYGHLLNIPTVVVMPISVPISHMQKCRDNGAKVFVQGTTFDEAQRYARAVGRDKGLTYINGRDHPDVLAGYGSLAMEIVQELPAVDAIILPVGTGGLAAAVSLIIKQIKPQCLVYGVQPEATSKFYKELENDQVEPLVVINEPTIADSVIVKTLGINSFPAAKLHLDKMLLVKEDWIARAMLHMYEKQRLVVEGAGALPLAAVIGSLVPELKLKNVVAIISGGNISTMIYSRVIERGLACEGRLIKFRVAVKDKSASQSELLRLIASGGYELVDQFQHHNWLEYDEYKMEISLTYKAKNLEHSMELKRILERAYPYDVTFETEPFNDKRTCPCYVYKNVNAY